MITNGHPVFEIFKHAIQQLKLLQESINGFLLAFNNGSVGYVEVPPKVVMKFTFSDILKPQ
jgi:hypothetical protein